MAPLQMLLLVLFIVVASQDVTALSLAPSDAPASAPGASSSSASPGTSPESPFSSPSASPSESPSATPASSPEAASPANYAPGHEDTDAAAPSPVDDYDDADDIY